MLSKGNRGAACDSDEQIRLDRAAQEPLVREPCEQFISESKA